MEVERTMCNGYGDTLDVNKRFGCVVEFGGSWGEEC